MMNTAPHKRKQITTPIRPFTREERYVIVASKRKKYARKQRFENIVLVPLAAIGIGILSVIGVIFLLLPLIIRLAGFALIVFAIIDMVVNGMNAWAFAWIALGIIIVSFFRFSIEVKR